MRHPAIAFSGFIHRIVHVVLFTFCVIPLPSYASTAGGIDTPEGVTVLPLSVEGVEGFGLVATGTNTAPNTVVLGNMGVGTSGPVNRMDVYGGAVIGTSYVGVAAPDNGLAVQGKVGVGTTVPQAMLDVKGSIKTGTATIGQACSPEGILAYDSTAHAPVYCNVSGVWASMSGGSGSLSCITVAGGGTATCGAGYTMTGGGCAGSSQSYFVKYGYPSGGSSWSCIYGNAQTTKTTSGTAYAICCH